MERLWCRLQIVSVERGGEEGGESEGVLLCNNFNMEWWGDGAKRTSLMVPHQSDQPEEDDDGGFGGDDDIVEVVVLLLWWLVAYM